MPSEKLVRIGTRGSPLALYQAGFVAEHINKFSSIPHKIEIVPFTTKGDQLTSERLINSGGKGLFTREIDEAVSCGDLHIGVHSLKDVPSHLPEGQDIVAYMAREDPRDGLLTRHGIGRLQDLPPGAIVGTASLRREAQALSLRPDLKVIPFRGRVETRIDKLNTGQADATFLAMAGLSRLGLRHLASPIPMRDMLPAAGQGIIAIAACPDRLSPDLRATLDRLSDTKTRAMATAERAFLETLDGSCRTAMAAQLMSEGGNWCFQGEVLHPSGRHKWTSQAIALLSTDLTALAALGRTAAERIRDDAGGHFPVFSD